MDLKGVQLRNAYGNLLTIGDVSGSSQTGSLYNGDGELITSLTIQGDLSVSGSIDVTGSLYLSNVENSSFTKALVLDTSTNKVYYNDSITGGTITSILAGDGLSGGTITTTGTMSLDTGSSHFNDGVKSKLDIDNVLSGSNISFDGSTLIVTGSVEISSSLILPNTEVSTSTRVLVLDTNTNKIHYNDSIETTVISDKIVSGEATASIQPGNFNVNTNTTITGSLTVSGSQIIIGNSELTGSLRISGSLEASGDISGSNLNITNHAVIGGNLSIGGAELDTSNNSVLSVGTSSNNYGIVEVTGLSYSNLILNTDYGDSTTGTLTIQTEPSSFSIIKQRNGRSSISSFEYTHGTSPSNDSLKIAVADSTRIYVGGDGNVGIQNGNSAPQPLTVGGNISGSGNLDIDGNSTIGGNLTVGGTLTAQEFYTEFVSASVIYESGSTKFGDSLDDTHIITGSMNLTGSLDIIGDVEITGSLNISSSLILPNTEVSTSTRVLVIDTSTNKIHYNDNPIDVTADPVGLPIFDDSSITDDGTAFAKFQRLLQKGVDGGSVFQNPIVSTFQLPVTSGTYEGGVLDSNGYIHFVPGGATIGSKISPDGIVSTYTLPYTTNNAYIGGVLDPNGNVHFIPYSAKTGSKISPDGIVSTYTLPYTTNNAYIGGVLDPNGNVHFIPYSAKTGSKVEPNGTVSTYTLPYTTGAAYWGGVLDPSGSVHFVPYLATTGSKVEPNGTVSTYTLPYTTGTAYKGGVLDPNGNVHFVPFNATTGSKVEPNGTVSTYTLVPVPTTLKYSGGVLAPNGDVHFVPYNATVGQKISPNGEASTYSIPDTSFGGYGGILNERGDIYMISGISNRIMKIHSQWGYEFDRGVCISPYLNKL